MLDSVRLKDVQGVLDALAVEVSKKGRSVRMIGRRTSDETILAKAQRTAWKEWRDEKLMDRFASGNRQRFGFAARAKKYDRRKGGLPDYVFTGRFREQLRKRTPKRRDTATEVVSRFSIAGGPLNSLGSQRGWIAEVRARKLVQRKAHVRRTASGPVQVRAYQQRANTYEYKPSPRTYAEEWALRPGEVSGVAARSDELALQMFRAAIYDKSGNLRTSVRARMRGGAA